MYMCPDPLFSSGVISKLKWLVIAMFQLMRCRSPASLMRLKEPSIAAPRLDRQNLNLSFDELPPRYPLVGISITGFGSNPFKAQLSPSGPPVITLEH